MAKKAATILAEAQQELLDTNAKLSETGRRRDKLLLAGDDTRPRRDRGRAGSLRQDDAHQVDRIRLLEQEAEAGRSRVGCEAAQGSHRAVEEEPGRSDDRVADELQKRHR